MSGEPTPGPWRACKDGECKCGFIWGADRATHVASAHGPGDLGQSWYGSDTACSEETQKANARLIASAPETAAERDRLRAEKAELVPLIAKIAAINIWRDQYSDGPDAVTADMSSDGARCIFTADEIRTARAALAKATATEGGDG